MPISISGSGTITGISAGGLPDGVITTDDIAANAVTYAKIGTTEQGQLCKAWVNFNGTGTVAIRASYNVSSITDNGTGNYTINFTSALADANYSTTISCSDEAGTGGHAEGWIASSYNGPSVYSSTAVKIQFYNDTNSGALVDKAIVCVAIFR